MQSQDKQGREHVEDLDVPEAESDEVKGGVSLNFAKIEYTVVARPDQVSVEKI
jgi:hypothetical protein